MSQETVVTQTPSAAPHEAEHPHHAWVPLDEEPLVKSLSTELPTPVGNGLATIVVLVSLVLFVWSLVQTWQYNPNVPLPLFQVSVAGFIVSSIAVFARSTFSYVIALIGAIAWIWVSVSPLDPVFMCVLQGLTFTLMIVGVVFAQAAIAYNKKPRF
ncbi:hypothetical protein [Leifsonia sp. A12D58]|uniref:hypothetical protein n=1 Tax=Leifsonia sp. A12D58 TaxID=3397674 RepID=UPI0039E043F9